MTNPATPPRENQPEILSEHRQLQADGAASSRDPRYASRDPVRQTRRTIRRHYGDTSPATIRRHMARVRKAFRMHERGVSARAIARALGWQSDKSVRDYLKKGRRYLGWLKRVFLTGCGFPFSGRDGDPARSVVLTPRQLQYIRDLCADLGLKPPGAWAIYSKISASGLIAALLARRGEADMKLYRPAWKKRGRPADYREAKCGRCGGPYMVKGHDNGLCRLCEGGPGFKGAGFKHLKPRGAPC